MGRRTVQVIREGGAVVRVTYDPDLAEYRCRLCLLGVQVDSADYFTDDEDDALNTARTMARDNAAPPMTDAEKADNLRQWREYRANLRD